MGSSNVLCQTNLKCCSGNVKKSPRPHNEEFVSDGMDVRSSRVRHAPHLPDEKYDESNNVNNPSSKRR